MPVLDDILNWSLDRPLWQRDALRRIITKGDLTAADVEELLSLCLAAHNAVDNSADQAHAELLTAVDIPSTTSNRNSVRLMALRDLRNVNALGTDQKLEFGAEGLTLVFGYNGSGKSGYARVLRAICRARDRDVDILPNAYTESEALHPAATVDYKVDGSDDTTSVHWEQGQVPPADLEKVSYFDADCAAVHVGTTNEIAYTPLGLDILPKLANIAREIGGRITAKKAQLSSEKPASLVAREIPEGTEVSAILQRLRGDTDQEALQRIALLSESDLSRIEILREALGSDPEKRAREVRNAMSRLQRLDSAIGRTERVLNTGAVRRIESLLQNVHATGQAATAAAQAAFGGLPIRGIGDAAWRALWESARKYSEAEAYRDAEFPFTGEGAMCVLCLQSLNTEAKGRFVRFEDFVRNDTQNQATRAIEEFNAAVSEISGLSVGLSAYADLRSDIPGDIASESQREVRKFFKVAWRIQRALLETQKSRVWQQTLQLPQKPDVSRHVTALQLEAQALETSTNSEQRAKLQKEFDELSAKQWLARHMDDVRREIERLNAMDRLEAAKRDTATTWITRYSSELTDQYVTGQLQAAFLEEVRRLGASYLPIELISPGGEYGEKQFKIALQGVDSTIAVPDILSDGEFRCIALAGFLSELSTEASGSGLVFDDPVSSIDHRWRRRIATRLVEVATDRQVIVFTHDIVFLSFLLRFASERDIAVKEVHIRRGVERPGECLNELPWEGLPVKRRIGYLKAEAQRAEAVREQAGSTEYDKEAKRIYGLLREAWERAIEEVLLNEVVMRMDFAIQTRRLSPVVDISDQDIARVDAGMTKASAFIRGHDEPEAVADPVPEPTELLSDIVNLENWVKEVRRRRN